MDFLHVIGILIAAGILLWAVNKWAPMDAKIKNILNIFVVIVIVLWLLGLFGVWSYLSGITVPRIGRG